MTQKKKGKKKEFDHLKKYPLNSERMNRENFTVNLGFQVVILTVLSQVMQSEGLELLHLIQLLSGNCKPVETR